jgi:3-oxoacyl-[acyl-carrier protein] reductase
MNLDLHGKRALVCGGSKGIGRACALALAELGASVCVVGRDEAALTQTVSDLGSVGKEGEHEFWQLDFDQLEETRKFVTEHTKDRGFDILINNSGGPAAGKLIDASVEDLVTGISRHILASHVITQAVFPHMKKHGFGRIINIISTSVKEPISGLGVSNTVRGAMGNWSKTMANELGPFGVTVNNLLPGRTRTGRLTKLMSHWAETRGISVEQLEEQSLQDIPLRRYAEPQEVGDIVAFLCTPSAGYITGTNIVVDGGRTRSL